MINIITNLSADRWEEYQKLRIKAVTDTPQAFLATVDEETNKPEEVWRKRLQDSLDVNGQFLVFAEDHGELVGLMGAFREENVKVCHTATVVSVYVDPLYRGQGISSLLMEALLGMISRDTKIIRLELMVVTTQEAAIALYKKSGFEMIGMVHKEVYVDGVYYDEYIMEKML